MATVINPTCSTGTFMAVAMNKAAYVGSGAPPLMKKRMRPPTAACIDGTIKHKKSGVVAAVMQSPHAATTCPADCGANTAST